MEIENLKQTLKENLVDFEVIHHEKPIKSRNDALCYFKLEEMAPTLILKSNNTFYALIISGGRSRVDLNKIKELLACEILQMASKKEVLEKINIETGRIPLVGHNLPCIIDEGLFKYDFVYGGTGDFMHTLKIRPKDLERMNNTILKINLD
jgi:Cys-tRNA(Pro)/Cys-tRNA(Cys) deacylase